MGLEIAIGLAVISFVVGGLLGHFGNREARSNKLRAAMLQAELEAAQSELADYRQEVVQQFSETAEKFRTLDESYHALHRQLATSAVALLADQDVPLLGEPRPDEREERDERVVGDVETVPAEESQEGQSQEGQSQEVESQEIDAGSTDLLSDLGDEVSGEETIVVTEPKASAKGVTEVGEDVLAEPLEDSAKDRAESQDEDQARPQGERQEDEVPILTDSPEGTARKEKSASA